MITIGDISRKGRKLYPDDEAIVFEETRLTYRMLDDRVNRLANAILKLGYKKGDTLTILAENTHKFVEVYLAAGKLGMVVTPLNFRLADNELVRIANDCEATLFFAGEGYEDRAESYKKNLKNIRQWISLDSIRKNFLYYEALLEPSSNIDPQIDVSEDDLAILMYTGGTTGLPKGVMLTHRNLLSSQFMSIIAYNINKQDALCFLLPLFHISLWPVLCTLMVGGKAALTRRPDLLNICKLIQEEKCTFTTMVPTLYSLLLNMPDLDDFDLSSMRLFIYGGSPVAPDVLQRMIKKFGNVLSQIYGSTEASGVATVLEVKDHALEGDPRITRRLNSIGRELMMVAVKVVDENDQEVKQGEVGEIVLRGKSLLVGYWKNPKQTSESWRNGWFHTGDMGMCDENGYIYLKDRKSDMIVTGGENVYPKEVEDIIYENSAVIECAVVSAPDAKWGERVVAVLTLREGTSLSSDEVISYCKTKLAGYKCPKEVLIWDEIPKTPIGKILRRNVKKHFWKDSDRLIG